MTLARKIYKLMEIGKEYHVKELADLLYKAEAEYMDFAYEKNISIEEMLDEEWLTAVSGGDLRKKIREALKITRKFGYTDVVVKVTPAHDWTGTVHWRDRHGICHSAKKTYHYDEFKDFTYRRIK